MERDRVDAKPLREGLEEGLGRDRLAGQALVGVVVVVVAVVVVVLACASAAGASLKGRSQCSGGRRLDTPGGERRRHATGWPGERDRVCVAVDETEPSGRRAELVGDCGCVGLVNPVGVERQTLRVAFKSV